RVRQPANRDRLGRNSPKRPVPESGLCAFARAPGILRQKRAARLRCQMPAYHGYPPSGDAEPKPLPNRFRLSLMARRSEVLNSLVAALAGNTQSKRSAEWDGQLTAVHTVGDESLRVHRIGHVDAFPPVGMNRTVDNVSGLGRVPTTSRM